MPGCRDAPLVDPSAAGMNRIPALWLPCCTSPAPCAEAQVIGLEFAQPGAHPASWYAWPARERERVRDSADATHSLVADRGRGRQRQRTRGEPRGERRAALRYRWLVYPRPCRVRTAGLKGDAGFCRSATWRTAVGTGARPGLRPGHMSARARALTASPVAADWSRPASQPISGSVLPGWLPQQVHRAPYLSD